MQPEQFRYSPSSIKQSQMMLLMGAIVIPLIGIVILSFATLINSENEGLLEVFFYRENGDLDWSMVAILIATLVSLFVTSAMKRGRIALSSAGIDLCIPRLSGLGLMKLSTGTHRIPVEQIREIRLIEAPGKGKLAQALQLSRLEIDTERGTFRLQPYHFLKEGGEDHRLGLREASRPAKDSAGAHLQGAPLVQSLRSLGFLRPQETGAGESAQASPGTGTGYDLLKHRGMLAQLALLGVLGVYGLVDYFVISTHYQLLGSLPWMPFAVSAVLVMGMTLPLGRGAPMVERLGVAGMVVFIAMAATYPGIQRYTLVVSDGGQPQQYHAAQPGFFTHADYPDIDFRNSNLTQYWAQFPAGHAHEFILHEGAGAFYILDLGPVHEKTRAFYRRVLN